MPAWPRFTEAKQQAMYFHNTASVIPVPDEAALQVLDTYFAWRRTPEGAAWAK
jgi:para-nitrobenzyl esterase